MVPPVMSGYTPTVGDSIMIVRAPLSGGVTLNAPAVTINAPGNDPHWTLEAVSSTSHDIRLVYIPEPTSILLVGLGMLMVATSRRAAARVR
jgi:hypothetical protein